MKYSYIRQAIFVTYFSLLPIFCASALDFDKDGLDDFVLVDIDQTQKLGWYAIDLNDSAKRFLGQFGEVGNHLAVGEWSGSSEKAFIEKSGNGQISWKIDLPQGLKSFDFGSGSAKLISGLDFDANKSIDPVTVDNSSKNLSWNILNNPASSDAPVLQSFTFGGSKLIPFFANREGSGDQIATAKTAANGILTLRYKNLLTSRVRTFKIGNFRSDVSSILPASLPNGMDVIFVINKQSDRIEVTIISNNKKIKTLKVKGDEAVVGKYLGGKTELLAIRTGTNKALLIYPNGTRRRVNLDLSGILADDININSFSDSSEPVEESPEQGQPAKKNPVCVGTADSREHLLYKPVSDTSGNAVLVFDSKYQVEFRAVRIEKTDGTFEEAWWKGLALWGNPDSFGPRQHWRTNIKASEVKDNALIIVDDTNQECRFMIPGSSRKRWE